MALLSIGLGDGAARFIRDMLADRTFREVRFRRPTARASRALRRLRLTHGRRPC